MKRNLDGSGAGLVEQVLGDLDGGIGREGFDVPCGTGRAGRGTCHVVEDLVIEMVKNYVNSGRLLRRGSAGK
jgi:hypothetical protein